MFSKLLHKNNHRGRGLLFFSVAALVIVGQLVAIALLAQGQVQKAALREARLTSQRIAMAQCFESSRRIQRDNCFVLAGQVKSTSPARSVPVLTSGQDESNLPVPSAAPRGLKTVALASNTPER